MIKINLTGGKLTRDDWRKAIILGLLSLGVFAMADAQETNHVWSGDTIKVTKTTKQSLQPIATGCIWVDSKNNPYPVFASSTTGSCFVFKVSSKTGNEYRYYLGEAISKEICAKIGLEYKPKQK